MGKACVSASLPAPIFFFPLQQIKMSLVLLPRTLQPPLSEDIPIY